MATMLSSKTAIRIAGLLALGCVLVGVAVSLGNTITPSGIVIHHLAVPPEIVPHLRIGEIDDLHRNRGYGAFFWGRLFHIGYHYVILPDGTILRGRPERLRGAHTFGYNHYLGIC